MQWQLQCDCGNTTTTLPSRVKLGYTKSCGCLKINANKISGTKSRRYNPVISSARVVWRTYKNPKVSFEDFYKLSQQPCHYCGIEPYRSYNVGAIERTHNGRYSIGSELQRQEGNFVYNGLDRIDSNKDHKIENVVPCCWLCNRMKLNMGVKDFLTHIDRISKHQYSIMRSMIP